MLCPKCKTPSSDNGFFCTKCGHNLTHKYKSILNRLGGFFLSILKTGASFLFIIFIISLISSLLPGSSGTNAKVIKGQGEDIVAVLNISGMITEESETGSFGALPEKSTSARNFAKTLQDLKEESNIKAVILRINSPGGSAGASEEMLKAVQRFKEERNVAVYSYLSDTAASGGYYVALGADHVGANPHTITGSIGVIVSQINIARLADEWGVKNTVYKSGKYKDLLNPFRETGEDETKIIQTLVDSSHRIFIDAVANGRGLDFPRAAELADGRIYTAGQAKDLNLIDSISVFEDYLDFVARENNLIDPSVIEYGLPSFFESFLGSAFRLPGARLEEFLNPSNGLKVLFLAQ